MLKVIFSAGLLLYMCHRLEQRCAMRRGRTKHFLLKISLATLQPCLKRGMRSRYCHSLGGEKGIQQAKVSLIQIPCLFRIPHAHDNEQR